MPHISEAMQRSMRRGVVDKVGEIVVRSLLGRRGITDEVGGVKNTFSSWDNCMAASYCKWPAIAIIVVVGLVVLSVIWCIIRCACCGMSCCCTCFRFLTCCDCCGCCGGCCDGKKNRPMKHLDDTFSPRPANQGYQAPAPMMGGGLGTPAPPQYAQFEVGKSGLAVDPKPLSEDALPPMPSWDSANKRRILENDEKDAMELGELNPAGQKLPLMTGSHSPGGMSPGGMSPGGMTPGGASPFGNNGYRGFGSASPIGPNQNGFNQNGRGFGGPQNGPGGRYGSPAPIDRGFGSPAPQDMSRGGYGPNSPQDMYANDGFHGAAVGGYGRPPPQRQYTNDSNRPYPPQGPQRQYSGSQGPFQNNQYQMPPPIRRPSRGPGGPIRTASPALTNNSGFDFGMQSEPQQMPYGGPQPFARSTPRLEQQQQRGYFDQPGSSAPPSYASRSPPPQDKPAYPGYKPYKPASPEGSIESPLAVTPGGGGRQPDRWDPVSH